MLGKVTAAEGDKVEAERLFRQAADAGDRDAMAALSKLLRQLEDPA
jgi:TPR repeat protein